MEHEKLGFNLGDNSRMDYAQIEAMLRKLESRFGWVPIIEAGRCVRCAWGGRGTTVLLWLGVIFQADRSMESGERYGGGRRRELESRFGCVHHRGGHGRGVRDTGVRATQSGVPL